jgi:hypothetical protein
MKQNPTQKQQKNGPPKRAASKGPILACGLPAAAIGLVMTNADPDDGSTGAGAAGAE